MLLHVGNVKGLFNPLSPKLLPNGFQHLIVSSCQSKSLLWIENSDISNFVIPFIFISHHSSVKLSFHF